MSNASFIRPLSLGAVSFPVNVIQGPLAGVSCAPFRRLIWEHSQPAFSCTEMISCKTILHQPKLVPRFTTIDPHEGPVCFQLSGNSPDDLAEATRRVTDLGADLINLNCGCPVTKIRARGAGSRLLAHPQLMYELITAMKRSTSVPVSVKIRVDGFSQDAFNQEIARVVAEAGADFIIVHGRHWTQSYEVGCHYDQIQFFVDELRIPVIGNGDVFCAASLQKMFETGCAGVMVARASVGQPWLIGQLMATLKQQPFIPPERSAIKMLFLQHVEALAVLLGSETFAIIQARKFAKYYARHLENRAEFCHEMNRCTRFTELHRLCDLAFSQDKLGC
jgi:tRNA-dihydrouridine synthase B